MYAARLAVLTICAMALWPRCASAQELEPRAFANTPVGMNFVLAGYQHIDGNVSLNTTLPIEDAKVRSDTGTFAYIRALDVMGMSGKVAFIVPFSEVKGTASVAGMPRERDISGFGDPKLRLSLNFLGAPALRLPEFAKYRQGLILGANLEIGAPLGQYDDDKLLNVGANRWTVKGELGASLALRPATLEASLATTVFTANDDFLGGHRLEQDPLYAAQGHAIYQFRPGLWGSFDGTYYWGGRPVVDGEPGESLADARLGLTLSMDVTRHASLKFYGTTGVYSRTGLEFDSVGLAFQVRWGGGL